MKILVALMILLIVQQTFSFGKECNVETSSHAHKQPKQKKETRVPHYNLIAPLHFDKKHEEKFLLGTAYNELYSLRKKTDALKAVGIIKYIQEKSFSLNIYCHLPYLTRPSSIMQMKKLSPLDIEEIENNYFISATIQANQELYEYRHKLLTLPEQYQHLKYLYYRNIYHIPTLVALVKTSWKLEEWEKGDNLLFIANRRFSFVNHWELMILQARKKKRKGHFDEAMNLLETTRNRFLFKANYADQLLKTWEEEMLVSNFSLQEFFDMGSLSKSVQIKHLLCCIAICLKTPLIKLKRQ